ncbi:hypothetical protein LOK49_LG02G04057 [Camellia lanceoleosa]|uniref:Uncharacterized protein n=1 Tax=Camellia lanceoleosa TaxID=1840588 RepID=A0ACC0IRR2_9ERIC|nr:hypothetical protein LOK49_LG02G04057 [Camellia lanceoleosa]
MCIAVFIWQDHPLYPFILLLNRDEYHNRPTKPLAWWEVEGGGGSCCCDIVGGRDGLAGGTWLASNRDGRVAFLTNVREVESIPQAKSRGHLPVRFLESKKHPGEFAEELVKEADQYNGFNLIIADLCSKTMVYITNRPKQDKVSAIQVSPGIHVLSNARLDSPWPKAERLRHSFKDQLARYGDGEVCVKEMVEKLMRDTVKDDKSMLPHIYPVEREYQMSSIFVEEETPSGRHGTRSTSALSVKASGEVNFRETYLEKEFWKEKSVTYQIEMMK